MNIEKKSNQIYISLLAHEKFDFLQQQLINIHKYMPSAKVFLHLSSDFNLPKSQLDFLTVLPFLTISKNRVHTHPMGLLHPHLINLQEIFEVDSFPASKIVFMASNELFINYGAESYICSHDCGVFHNAILSLSKNKDIIRKFYSDVNVNVLINDLHIKTIIWSQIEGSFYRLDILKDVYHVITSDHTSFLCPKEYYPEEIILPTIACHFMSMGTYKSGFPITFSEVSMYSKYVSLASKFRMKIIRRITVKFLSIMFGTKITIFTVCVLRSRFKNILKPYAFFSNTARYDLENIYSVKRVPRNTNSRLVRYIYNLDVDSPPVVRQ